MQITAVRSFQVKVGHRNNFIVKIDTDAGISGVGEGGMSGRERAMQGAIEHYERVLVGMDPKRIEHIWQVLYRSQYFEGGKVFGAAISAIDIALWDILGQTLGVPVYQLLGGACRERVQCFATPATLNGPHCVEQARAAVDAGWTVLRFMTGMDDKGWSGGTGATFEPMESLDLAAHWIREIRHAVGPRIGLAIDFHHRLSVAEAALFCQKVAGVHLMFLEEPIRAQSPKAYAQLRAMTPMPFAVGEEFSSKWEFLPFVEDGLLNFARIDVCNVGGLSEARKVAGWCEAHYIDIMPHNPLGPVCTAATIHLAAATSNFALQEYQQLYADDFPHDLFPTAPVISGDCFPLPTRPGLGVTFDEVAAERYAFEFWEAPHWNRRDGAHTNW
jgi:galactonate dehydratase